MIKLKLSFETQNIEEKLYELIHKYIEKQIPNTYQLQKSTKSIPINNENILINELVSSYGGLTIETETRTIYENGNSKIIGNIKIRYLEEIIPSSEIQKIKKSLDDFTYNSNQKIQFKNSLS
jgi:hypothetical protein